MAFRFAERHFIFNFVNFAKGADFHSRYCLPEAVSIGEAVTMTKELNILKSDIFLVNEDNLIYFGNSRSRRLAEADLAGGLEMPFFVGHQECVERNPKLYGFVRQLDRLDCVNQYAS